MSTQSWASLAAFCAVLTALGCDADDTTGSEASTGGASASGTGTSVGGEGGNAVEQGGADDQGGAGGADQGGADQGGSDQGGQNQGGQGGGAAECGDGLVEQGEACDDGNVEPHDGCSPLCAAEELGWDLISAEGPSFSYGHIVDNSAELLVVKLNEDLTHETWGFASGAWSARTGPPVTATEYAPFSFEFNALHGRSVLYLQSATVIHEGGWGAPQDTPGGYHLSGEAMTYDALRDRMVLFGGHVGWSSIDHTYVYELGTWSQLDPKTRPSPRHWPAMVYDSARDRVVLFGGHYDEYLNDVWEFDGEDWAQVSAQPPPNDSYLRAAYDPIRSLTVAIATENGSVYEYDGNDWTASAVAFGPGGVSAATFSQTYRGVVVSSDTGYWVLRYR